LSDAEYTQTTDSVECIDHSTSLVQLQFTLTFFFGIGFTVISWYSRV